MTGLVALKYSNMIFSYNVISLCPRFSGTKYLNKQFGLLMFHVTNGPRKLYLHRKDDTENQNPIKTHLAAWVGLQEEN